MFRKKKTVENSTIIALKAIFDTLDFTEMSKHSQKTNFIVIARRDESGLTHLQRSTIENLHAYAWPWDERGTRRCYIERVDHRPEAIFRVFVEIAEVSGLLRNDDKYRNFQGLFIDGVETRRDNSLQENGPDGMVPFQNWPHRTTNEPYHL